MTTANAPDRPPTLAAVEALGRPKQTAQQRRRRRLLISLVVFALVPSLVASVYYGLIASKQYAVEVRFAVRGIDSAAASSELLGMFTGAASSGSTLTDAYILVDYIHSKEILLRISETMDIQKPFSISNADMLAAFWWPGAPVEVFLEYWKKMVRTSLDSASRIVTVEVRAFNPDDALKIAQSIVLLSERLVNELSERARKDAVLVASQEVERMENRLRRSNEPLRAFREKRQDIDPSQTAQANLQRLSSIQTQINEARARLVTQRSYMTSDAPPVLHTVNQIKALEEQMKLERDRLGTGAGSTPSSTGTLSGAVDDYQGLLLEQDFAQKAYVSALSSLERARITADQQQRYLGTFVPPRKPESAIYPRRVLSIVIFVFLNIVIWAIGVLAVYAIRDHAVA
jgi:capsular polysaccharide transport system permease protein